MPEDTRVREATIAPGYVNREGRVICNHLRATRPSRWGPWKCDGCGVALPFSRPYVDQPGDNSREFYNFIKASDIAYVIPALERVDAAIGRLAGRARAAARSNFDAIGYQPKAPDA